ncbi:MAG: hypothetical protein IKT08_06615 [Bacteroidales bacterium]|nr:hypothetical protein [Bacteroidales bacterium]
MIDWLAYFTPTNVTVTETGPCRFEHDHLCSDTEDVTVVIDGLILNQKELFQRYGADDFLQLVLTMRHDQPKVFFKEFRGPFTGLYYDKQARQAVVFTNHTGDSAVFHYQSETLQAFSSNFMLLLEFLQREHIDVHFDEKAAHWMLTFGYLIDDATFVKEIKRLRAGKALYLDQGHWTEQRYHCFSSNTLSITENETIERIDTLFRQAVKRCFDKDLEYGFKRHLVDMSAGMDSRMVNCVAKTLGYGPITNISYSQTGSEEEVLSKQASKLFGNEMVFEALDNHEFIYDIDTLLRGNFGTYLYTGITGGARLLSRLDFSQFGAEQTGQLGDITIGTFVKGNSIAVDPEAVRLSHRLPLRFDPNPELFENQDLFSLYTRGFMGAMSSWFIRKQYTFALSPFTDVDFMGFCYDLPIAMRKGHNLYWKWVECYYPEALEVPSSRKRMPVTTAQKAFDLMSRAYHKGLKMGRKLLFKAGWVPSRIRPEASMNPYEYWYDTDPRIREFFETYYREHRSLLVGSQTLLDEVDAMFRSDAMLDKLMALTVLGAANNFIPSLANPSSPATT